MATDLSHFIKALSTTGLLAEAEVAALRERARQNPNWDPRDVARELVKQRKLTWFQARTIYQGGAKSLIVGNYVIQNRLGGGGMGQVYRAQHRHMKRLVALKILSKSNINTLEATRRFQREVEAAAKLNHPNIVTAHDADVANGVHYLVMELVDGRDLHSLVRERGTVSPADAVNWVLQAARGLEYAHQRHIVHRDIKPGNLLLSTDNVIKILDMGLARINETEIGDETSDVPLTQMGEIIGTIDFMSPEQAEDTRKADARSDIYSLGCTLYFLLTGDFPYSADTIMKKLLAHREQPVPSLIAKDRKFAPELDRVFQKMVSKRPEQRYQTMTEVIAALQQCAAVVGDSSSPPSINALPATGTESEELDLDTSLSADTSADPGDLEPAQPAGGHDYTAKFSAPDTHRVGTAVEEPAAPVRKKPVPPAHPIVVACECGALFAALPAMAGKTTRCGSCQRPLTIPSTFQVELVCKCGQRYAATENVMGRNVICSHCRALMTIPKPKPIEVSCRCGQRFAAAPKLAGKTVRCSSCGAPITVPGPPR